MFVLSQEHYYESVERIRKQEIKRLIKEKLLLEIKKEKDLKEFTLYKSKFFKSNDSIELTEIKKLEKK